MIGPPSAWQRGLRPAWQGSDPPPVGGALTGNLLLWTEEMDDAVWVKQVVVVTPDTAPNPSPPGDGSSSADLCAWSGSNRTIKQLTAIAAVTGASSSTFTPSSSWNREFVTVTIDSVDYVASVYVMDQGLLGNQLRLFLEVSGGVIQVRLLSSGGPVSAYIWGWQLEQGSTATTYQRRQGT